MSRLRRAFLLQVAGILVFVALLVWLGQQPAILDWVIGLQRRIVRLEQWGLILYPLLFAVCNILLLPGGIIAVGGGLFFGLWWGFAITLAGNMAGAAVAFAVSRWLGRQWIERKMARYPKLIALDRAISREGWKIIFWSQLHPLFPTSLLNYLYGMTRIGFWRCMVWTTLARVPGLFLYAYLGTLAQLGIKLLRGLTQPEPGEYVVWIGGLVLTAVITTALGRIALRILREIEESA